MASAKRTVNNTRATHRGSHARTAQRAHLPGILAAVDSSFEGTLDLPRAVGRYVLVQQLASGGMGAVYHALQGTRLSGVERLVVVKLALPRLATHPKAVKRFLHEAHASMLLHHRNICTTYDVDTSADGVIVLAMESIHGKDVRQLLRGGSKDSMAGEPTLSVQEAVALAGEALDGLDYAHALKDPRNGEPLHLVHRDISPHNLMVSYSGEVKIIDFGIARSELRVEETAAGTVVGKLRYMAPEQLTGAGLDRRADLYCVGIIVAELLSGVRYYGDVNNEAIATVLSDPSPFESPALRALTAPMRAVLERALSYEPRDRFGTAAAFKDALFSVAGGAPPAGTLRRAMSRLFAGEEEREQRKVQELYKRALDPLRGGAGVELPQRFDDDAPTTRKSASAVTPFEPTVRFVRPSLPSTEVHDDNAYTAVSPTPVLNSSEPDAHDSRTAVRNIDELHSLYSPASADRAAVASQGSDGASSEALADGHARVVEDRDTVRALRDISTAVYPAPAIFQNGRGIVIDNSPTLAPAQEPARRGWLVALGVAAALLFVGLAVTATFHGVNVDGGQQRSSDAGAAVWTDAGARVATLAAAAGTNDAGARDVDAGVDAPADAGVDVVMPPRRNEQGRRRTTRPPEAPPPLPPKPQRLGDRVRYLSEHCRALPCANSAAAKASELFEMQPEQIRSFTADVNFCLDRCAGP